jgi:hypothetical protein
LGPSDVRNLVLNENLQNERSHFVLKSTAQCLNSRAVDDVLKLAADASVGAVYLLSDSGSYRFGSLNIQVEPLDYDYFGHFLSIVHGGLYVPSWATGPRCPSCLQNVQTLLDLFNLYCCFASGPCKAEREGAGNSANSAESIQQLQKVSTISNLYCGESQSHSTASRHVPHYTFDPDLSFVNQKVNLRYGIDRPCLSSFEKHTTTPDIQNSGGFGAPITMPIGPDALSLEPWAKPSCRENI